MKCLLGAVLSGLARLSQFATYSPLHDEGRITIECKQKDTP